MYSDIPIHIRLSERWLVDPGYDKWNYHKRESILARSRTGRQRVFRNVPQSVLAYLSTVAYSSDVRENVVGAAAYALGMLPLDLMGMIKTYRTSLLKAG